VQPLRYQSQKGKPLLQEVDQVGADVFRAESLWRRFEVSREANDALDVGIDSLGREIAQVHILDHAATQGRHVRLLYE
jgi:hypothetical protein